jgi:hypothetical protein
MKTSLPLCFLSCFLTREIVNPLPVPERGGRAMLPGHSRTVEVIYDPTDAQARAIDGVCRIAGYLVKTWRAEDKREQDKRKLIALDLFDDAKEAFTFLDSPLSVLTE